VIGASGLPNTGDPLSKNVLIVTFAGPICSIVGVGSSTSPVSFWLNPKNMPIITIDAITAPIPSEGPCINKQFNFLNTFSLLFYGVDEPPLSDASPKLKIWKVFDDFEFSFSAFIVTSNVCLG